MVCLLKNKYKAELKHYASILGSEEAAYYVLAANNGYTLDKTPQGLPSTLYEALLDVKQSEAEAVISKSMAYTPQFFEQYGDWTDTGIEPDITKLNDDQHVVGGEALSEVLQDGGKFLETVHELERSNIVDHSAAIPSAIGATRDEFVRRYLDNWFEEHKEPTQQERVSAVRSARRVWTIATIDRLMSGVQSKLADAFGLKQVQQEDGTIVYESTTNDDTSKLRVEFVNNLTRQAAFQRKNTTDATLNLIQISLNNGDPTDIIHELLHFYVRQFWNTNLIQDALRIMDAENPGRNKSRDLEEYLVGTITDKIVNTPSKLKQWASNFYNAVRKMLHALTFGIAFKEKQNVLDLITAYFQLNKDLSDDVTQELTYEMYEGVVYHEGNLSESEVFDKIVKGIKSKIKALSATNAPIQEISRVKQDLEKAEARDKHSSSDVQATIEDFFNQAIDELCRVQADVVRASIQADDPTQRLSINIQELLNLQTNVLNYYANIFDKYIGTLLVNPNVHYLNSGTLLRNQYDEIGRLIDLTRQHVDKIISRQCDQFIDDFVEANVDVGDKERFKLNAKYWLRNEIDSGNLQFGELFFGGTTSSYSPIVRMIEFMISQANTQVRLDTLPVGHRLQALYDKCSHRLTLGNFMKRFCELDRHGRATGYFIRDINYGQFYDDRDDFIRTLDKKYNVTISVDQSGQETRVWKSDKDWKDYQDELDDWYDTHAHRRFKSEYYKLRRKYLSKDTIQALDDIQSRINTILDKCTDPTTKIPYTFELSQEDRQQLRQLERDKDQLSNPYIILTDSRGVITKIVEKTGDAKRMSDEIVAWRKATQGRIKYNADEQKFEQVRKYVEQKYGNPSLEMSMFMYDYMSREINPFLWDLIGHIEYDDPAISKKVYDLKARKRAILNFCYEKKHHYAQPDLSRLSDDAFAELKKIDEELAKLSDEDKSTIGVRKHFKEIFQVEEVTLPSGGSYLSYLLDKAQRDQAHNPNAVKEFYDKYYYKNKDGQLVPLTAFFYVKPIYQNTVYNNVSYPSLIDSPIGAFRMLDQMSDLADPEYDPTLNMYSQPKRSVYDNTDAFNKIIGDKANKAFYEALLEAMDNAYKKLPHYHDRAKYLLPQIEDKRLAEFAGGWYDIVAAFKPLSKHVDADIDFGQTTEKPDGSPLHLIPIRWNRRRKDIKLDLDLLYTVTAFVKMANEYEQKSKIIPQIEALISESRKHELGDHNKSDQTKRLEDYVDTNIYSNTKKPLVRDKFTKGGIEKFFSLIFGGITKLAHAMLMSHNWRAVLKNYVDSSLTMFADIGGGKYYTKKDWFHSVGYMLKDFINAFADLGAVNNRGKLSAAMQFTGAADTIEEQFKGRRYNPIYRIIKKHLCMGEYTLVDYTSKGLITGMVFHHYRLIINPKTGKEEFLSRDQAKYAYLSTGKTSKEGEDAWSSANTTLWDAYSVDKEGNFVLDKKYEDIVRPYDPVLKRRSNKLETRIAGTIRERGSVINGVMDSANKGNMYRNYLGSAFMQMRGWTIAHGLEYFKVGDDFSEFDKLDPESGLSKKADDPNFSGQYNFETGAVERGTVLDLCRALKKLAFWVGHLIRVSGMQKLNDNEKSVVRKYAAITCGLIMCILCTILSGKWIEKDPDNKLAWFSHSVSVAATSERLTTIPGLQVFTVVDVIRQPFVAAAWFQQMGSTLNVVGDVIESQTNDPLEDGFPEYNRTITSGTYTNAKVWQRDALKATSALYPYININNPIKNIRKESNRSSINYYQGIFPTSFVTYKPRLYNKGKQNAFSEFADWLYSDDKFNDIWQWTKDISNK